VRDRRITTPMHTDPENLLTDRDEDIELILQHFGLPQTYAESFGLRLPYGRLRQLICRTICGEISDRFDADVVIELRSI
jgi:hypothetical protein